MNFVLIGTLGVDKSLIDFNSYFLKLQMINVHYYLKYSKSKFEALNVPLRKQHPSLLHLEVKKFKTNIHFTNSKDNSEGYCYLI